MHSTAPIEKGTPKTTVLLTSMPSPREEPGCPSPIALSYEPCLDRFIYDVKYHNSTILVLLRSSVR
jgi:hypothetical protein